MNKDLTVGPVRKSLLLFSLPLMGSMAFQQLYNMADSLIAGRFLGENALAAVGNGHGITLVYLAFATGCHIGCSVIVSQFFGAKKYSELKTTVYVTFIIGALICAALMAAGLTLAPPLFTAMNTPDNIFFDSILYLNIYTLSLPFVFFYNIANGIFSALGDSRTPFMFLMVSSLSNIAVDILFVSAFKMGVEGLAWATFLCQGVSCILAMTVVLKRLGKIRLISKAAVYSPEILKRVMIVAIPTICQQLFISIGNIFIQGFVNSFGSEVIAGYSAAIRMNNFVVNTGAAFGNGTATFVAQNLGARKYDRIREGIKNGLLFSVLMGIAAFLVFYFGGRSALSFFITSDTGLAMKSGWDFFRIVSPFYFIVMIKFAFDAGLKGASLMGRFMICTFADLILRVVLSFILSGFMGYTGIWCSWPFGWAMGAAVSMIFYFTGKKKYMKIKI